MTIPAGALAERTTVSVHILRADQWPADVARGHPIGNVYSLEPDGLQFAKPVGLTWHVSRGALSGWNPHTLLPVALSRSASGTLAALSDQEVEMDLAGPSVTAVGTTPHFSLVELVPGVLTAELVPDSVTAVPGAPWNAHVVIANLGNTNMGFNADLQVENVTDFSTQPVAVLPVEHKGTVSVAVGKSATTDPVSMFVCGGTGIGRFGIGFTIRFSGGMSGATWNNNTYKVSGSATCTATNGSAAPTTTAGSTTTTAESTTTTMAPKYPMAIHAEFNQGTFTTVYTEPVIDPSWTYTWSVMIPADPGCASGFKGNTPAPNQASWYHANVTQGGPCNHTGSAITPRGHPGQVTLVVTSSTFRCQAQYYGTETGDSTPPQCVRL